MMFRIGRLERVFLLGGMGVHPLIEGVHGSAPFEMRGPVGNGPGIDMSASDQQISAAEEDDERNDDTEKKSAHISPCNGYGGALAYKSKPRQKRRR